MVQSYVIICKNKLEYKMGYTKDYLHDVYNLFHYVNVHLIDNFWQFMAMLPPTTMVAALTLMVPSTWARGLLMLSQRLMLLFCVDLMVMLSPTHMHTLATSDTLLAGAK